MFVLFGCDHASEFVLAEYLLRDDSEVGVSLGVVDPVEGDDAYFLGELEWVLDVFDVCLESSVGGGEEVLRSDGSSCVNVHCHAETSVDHECSSAG